MTTPFTSTQRPTNKVVSRSGGSCKRRRLQTCRLAPTAMSFHRLSLAPSAAFHYRTCIGCGLSAYEELRFGHVALSILSRAFSLPLRVLIASHLVQSESHHAHGRGFW
eukprot:scaffold240389_cov28-Tisochrysis_lutea.AAC.2